MISFGMCPIDPTSFNWLYLDYMAINAECTVSTLYSKLLATVTTGFVDFYAIRHLTL